MYIHCIYNIYIYIYIYIFFLLRPSTQQPSRKHARHALGRTQNAPICLESQCNDPVPGLLRESRGARARNRPSAARGRPHARPLRQKGKGDLKLPNLRHVRCAPPPLGRRPSHDRKDFSTCMPLNQEDPDISTQLM